MAAELAALRAQIQLQTAYSKMLLEQNRAHEETLDLVFRSWSWRLTDPLRRIYDGISRRISRRQRNQIAVIADEPPVPSPAPTPSTGLSRAPRKRILIAEHRLPMPDRHSGSLRLAMMIRCIRELGWEVTFVSEREPADRSYELILGDVGLHLPKYERLLAERGVEVLYGYRAAYRHFEREGETYAAVILQFPHVMFGLTPLVRAFMPKAWLIYDTVDLHGLRIAREADLHPDDAGLRREAALYQRMEAANVEAADEVIAITPEEEKQIHRMAPEARIRVISNIHTVSPAVPPLTGRSGLLFIGHYLHTPNEDAMVHFLEEILPRVRDALGTVPLWMLGSNLTDRLIELAARRAEVHAVGYVENVEPHFARARVFVAPLRFGAGMKGKIGQSLGLGLPVVTTSIGAEGMSLVHDRSILVADEPAEFAKAVVRLYREDELWSRLSRGGREEIERRYSEPVVGEAIRRMLEAAEAWRGEECRNGGPTRAQVAGAAHQRGSDDTRSREQLARGAC